MKNKAIKAMGLTTAILTTVGTTTVLAEEVETVEVVTEKATTNETVIEGAREKASEKQEEVDTQTIVANQTTKETERIGKEKDAKAVEVADAKTELVGKEGTVTEKEEKVEELEALKDNATIEKPKVEKGIADTNQEIGTKENDVNGKVTEVDGIKQQVTAQEGVVASETSKLDAITEEKEKLVNANTELSNALKQQDVANKEVATQTSNVANAEQTKSDLAKEKSDILEANADKQADITRLEGEISGINSQIAEKDPLLVQTGIDLEALRQRISQLDIPALIPTDRFMELMTVLIDAPDTEEELIAEGKKSIELNKANKEVILSKFDNVVRYDLMKLPLEMRYKVVFLVQDLVKEYQLRYRDYILNKGGDRKNFLSKDEVEFVRNWTGEWSYAKEAMEASQYLADYATNDTWDPFVDIHNDRAIDASRNGYGNYIAGENIGIINTNKDFLENGYTERKIMELVVSFITGMLFDDAHARWGHRTIATEPVTKQSYLGFAISKGTSQYIKERGYNENTFQFHFNQTRKKEYLERDGLVITETEKPDVNVLRAEQTEKEAIVERLSGELSTLRADLATKTGQVRKLSAGIVGLEDVNARIERNETTLANFRQALATAQSNKTVADDLVAKATEKVSNYNDLVARESAQRAVVEREVAKLNDLKGQLATKEQELSTLRNELSALNTKVATLTERLNTLNNVDSLLSEAKSELALAVSERDVLKQTIVTLEAELLVLVGNYNDAKVVSDAEQAKLDELRAELAFLQEELRLIEVALTPVTEEEKPAFVGIVEQDGKKWEVKADGSIVEIKDDFASTVVQGKQLDGGSVRPVSAQVKTLPQTGSQTTSFELLGLSALTVAVLLSKSGYRSRKLRR